MRITLAIGIALLLTAHASAQGVVSPSPGLSSPFARPALSPYLNLLRGGDPAANYYLGVLPEYNARATALLADYNYRFNLMQSNQTISDPNLFGNDEQLSPTGHPAAFMHYNGHYQLPARPFIPFNPGQSRPPLRR